MPALAPPAPTTPPPPARGLFTHPDFLKLWAGQTVSLLGSQITQLALPLNNLALLYDTTGRYADAEPLLERAITIKEKALGPEHP